MPFADTFDGASMPIDIVMGMDFLPSVLLNETPLKASSLLLTSTVFGLTIGGRLGAVNQVDPSLSSVSLTMKASEVETSLVRLLDQKSDLFCSENLRSDVHPEVDSERYQVSLPWLDESRQCFSFVQPQLRHRSSPSRPFQSSGLDHFGRLLRQVFVLFFICCLTMVLPLEAVDSTDTRNTSLPTSRFVADLSAPKFFTSDNGMNTPRNFWPMDLVQRLINGLDGVPRAVILKTKNALRLPVDSSFPFEVHHSSSSSPGSQSSSTDVPVSSNDSSTTVDPPVFTKSGKEVKRPRRFK